MADAMRLEHVSISARGDAYEQTVNFYERVFGWTRVRNQTEPNRLCFISDGHGGYIEIQDADGATLQNASHLAFAVPLPEFEDKRNQLAELGVAFDLVVPTPSGDVLAYFNDPAGNRAQIVGRKEALP